MPTLQLAGFSAGRPTAMVGFLELSVSFRHGTACPGRGNPQNTGKNTGHDGSRKGCAVADSLNQTEIPGFGLG